MQRSCFNYDPARTNRRDSCQMSGWQIAGYTLQNKAVPLSFWVSASIYSTFTVFLTTTKTERTIITLYNRIPFKLMPLSAVFYCCLKFQKAGFLFYSILFAGLPKTNPSISFLFLHLQTFSYLNKATVFFLFFFPFLLEAAVSKEMSVLFF